MMHITLTCTNEGKRILCVRDVLGVAVGGAAIYTRSTLFGASP